MNKVRVFGLFLLILASVLIFTFKTDIVYGLSGLIIGLGLGALITGRFKSKPTH